MPPRVSLHRAIVAVAGLGLVAVGLWLTHAVLGPVPGPGHVDGRGLFVEYFVVPPVTVGGLMLASLAVGSASTGTSDRLVRPIAYLAAALLAVSLPLAYVVFLSGPGVDSRLSNYRDWYVLALLLAAIGITVDTVARFVRARW